MNISNVFKKKYFLKSYMEIFYPESNKYVTTSRSINI